MTATTMSLDQIRRTGLQALANALGPVGLVRFLQLYETGTGDYSKARHEWLGGDDLAHVAARIMEDQEQDGP